MQSLTINFKGITNIYSLTDTHQDTRKTRTLLSETVNTAQKNNNVLLLNCGDMFKGIYSRELEADSFIKAKELAPNLEIVTTLGNNDFGFNNEHLKYLINTIKNFAQKGIKTVSANIFSAESGKRPKWIKPYTIIERDGDKNFITGFCIDNINSDEIVTHPPKEVIQELKKAIEREKPDNIIILNHDYLGSSIDILNYSKSQNIPVDIIIGGHDHIPGGHLHTDENIFYPPAFSEGLLNFKINKQENKKRVEDLKIIDENSLHVNKELEKDLTAYEKEKNLLAPVAPCRIRFTKEYSNPCSLGSFLADEIKNTLNTDICIFSTGLLVKPLPYKDTPITNYDFQKTMMAKMPVKKIELTPAELKQIFEHSFKNRTMDITGNSKFLQASSNIQIDGICNKKTKEYTVKEIYINKIPVLGSNRQISCAVDEFIANGGQGFNILKNKVKEDTTLRIDEALRHALSITAMNYPKGSDYPQYKINERVIK